MVEQTNPDGPFAKRETRANIEVASPLIDFNSPNMTTLLSLE